MKMVSASNTNMRTGDEQGRAISQRVWYIQDIEEERYSTLYMGASAFSEIVGRASSSMNNKASVYLRASSTG
jgi:hypothetical protein